MRPQHFKFTPFLVALGLLAGAASAQSTSSGAGQFSSGISGEVPFSGPGPATMGSEPLPLDDERVIPIHRADVEMTRKVRDELERQDLSREAKSVSISTYRGQVTLRGEVPSNEERSMVVEVANEISHSVRDELSVRQ